VIFFRPKRKIYEGGERKNRGGEARHDDYNSFNNFIEA
jgi:hypothetical protein